MLAWAALTTLYYVSFLVPLLPIPRSVLPPLAGAGLAACALGTALQRRPEPPLSPDWLPVRLGVLLLLAPVAFWALSGRPTPPTAPAGDSVRLMTYNIRSAFGLKGRLDVDAIAQVVRGAGADVVCLQELSRGWLITGGADLLPLLSRRLSMPHLAMGPATDPLFGNALASRYPFQETGNGLLPGLDALVGRGYVWAYLPWQADTPLLIIGTHLDSDRRDARLAQLDGLLAVWAGRPRTVLLGDFNALPGSPEIERIQVAGFLDAWAQAGHPHRPRIDWIFHTPDLVARDVVVIESPASDHPAFAATISPQP
jgi:endonuclease/exonuclease/phosphatase family metal-dependent hydrolase